MKASELIANLSALIETHGDDEVYVDFCSDGLGIIGEVDYSEEDGIVIWLEAEDDGPGEMLQ